LRGKPLTHSHLHRTGFVYPEGLVRNERLRSAALTRLIALTVVIASLAVLATTLSFGMAQARHCPASALTLAR
jgi:choline-glycine betaine transporter